MVNTSLTFCLGVIMLVVTSGQSLCPESCSCKGTQASCSNQQIMSVPEWGENVFITNLDLSGNNITSIPRHAFKKLRFLEELNLDRNGVENLDTGSFAGTRLKMLSLRGNKISDVPENSFSELAHLETLHLDLNTLDDLPVKIFHGLLSLQQLLLNDNLFTNIPTSSLAYATNLQALHLGNNTFKTIPANSFVNMSKLIILMLESNKIRNIDDTAFSGLEHLKLLALGDNELDQVPSAIQYLKNLEELSLSDNMITYIPDGSFQENKNLQLIKLKGNPILTIGRNVFAYLPNLKKLILSEAKELRDFPNLNGTSSLEVLRLDRASIHSIPRELCSFLPALRSLNLKSNVIEVLPKFEGCHNLRLLELSNNRIMSIKGGLFSTLSKLHDLMLGRNFIHSIPEDAFIGLDSLETLDLVSNKISFIHENAFLPLENLEDLNVGNSLFSELPTNGLENILNLKTFNNPNLREFPSITKFPKIRYLALSYAYHCCQFLSVHQVIGDNEPIDEIPETILFPDEGSNIDMTLWGMNVSELWPGLDNLTSQFGEFSNDLMTNFGPDSSEFALNSPSKDFSISPNLLESRPRQAIQCIPVPGPFMPCEDLFDWWTLRCGVWIVFLLALLGNGTVVFVLIFSRSKMDVPRFLVCNLAMADFFMGVYLGFLAVVDASTLGEFRKYAIPWQMSAGCQVAGFLGVLSSELSVFTLAVITLERNYAITHAMHLNKRLSLRHAAYIMLGGWTFSLLMATMPLFGISDYRKFAVCLPFETEGASSLTYVVFLMFINGISFLTLMGCYLKMYCAIRGSQAWNSNDSRIAKRMALLVFTDFICWFPVAFFSVTAALGLQLISLEEAKVFTVFVLPLNSCCNPFLYAILTKQFKKDCVLICKAIEESRVTRGIGRCRHSSNFSNRHTPACTNSMAHSSSKESQPCSCQSKLLDTRKPVKRFTWSYLTSVLCNRTKIEEFSSSNYAYQIADLQQKQFHKRAHNNSLSSDNFSSSRSDSFKHRQKPNVPLRILQKRRNSWNFGPRRGSQDSNLSSSRNDSSCATNSTATWRLSRSSISSDGGSRGKGSVKEKKTSGGIIDAQHKALPKPNTTINGQAMQTSVTGRKPQNLFYQRNPASNSMRLPKDFLDSRLLSKQDWNRPRLIRQSAIQEIPRYTDAIMSTIAKKLEPLASVEDDDKVSVFVHNNGTKTWLSTTSGNRKMSTISDNGLEEGDNNFEDASSPQLPPEENRQEVKLLVEDTNCETLTNDKEDSKAESEPLLQKPESPSKVFTDV